MSFISYESYFNPHVNRYSTKIVDSEFGEIDIVVPYNQSGYWSAAAIVKAYGERNLPIGKNLALATIYYSKLYSENIRRTALYHDTHLSELIPNWNVYAKERDEYLEKLLALA